MDQLHRAIVRARAGKFPVKTSGNHEPNEPSWLGVRFALVEQVKTLEALCEVFSQRLGILEKRLVALEHGQEDAEAPPPPRRPTVEAIQHAVCRAYSIPMASLLGHQHCARIVRPRHIAMYLCTRLTLRSLPDIARRFGNRDHTTIMNARNRITQARRDDLELANELAEFERQLGGLHETGQPTMQIT